VGGRHAQPDGHPHERGAQRDENEIEMTFMDWKSTEMVQNRVKYIILGPLYVCTRGKRLEPLFTCFVSTNTLAASLYG